MPTSELCTRAERYFRAIQKVEKSGTMVNLFELVLENMKWNSFIDEFGGQDDFTASDCDLQLIGLMALIRPPKKLEVTIERNSPMSYNLQPSFVIRFEQALAQVKLACKPSSVFTG